MTSATPCLEDSAPAARTPAQIALVLIALGMGGFAIGMAEFAAMSILPQFQAGLGLDAAQAGHVISAYAAGVVVGAPILAVMGARAPRWLLLIGFMALFAVANTLSAIAPTYEWMLVFRFLSGVPHGAYFGVAALVIASIVPLAWRTRAVSTTLLGLTVATVIGVPGWDGAVCAGEPRQQVRALADGARCAAEPRVEGDGAGTARPAGR